MDDFVPVEVSNEMINDILFSENDDSDNLDDIDVDLDDLISPSDNENDDLDFEGLNIISKITGEDEYDVNVLKSLISNEKGESDDDVYDDDDDGVYSKITGIYKFTNLFEIEELRGGKEEEEEEEPPNKNNNGGDRQIEKYTPIPDEDEYSRFISTNLKIYTSTKTSYQNLSIVKNGVVGEGEDDIFKIPCDVDDFFKKNPFIHFYDLDVDAFINVDFYKTSLSLHSEYDILGNFEDKIIYDKALPFTEEDEISREVTHTSDDIDKAKNMFNISNDDYYQDKNKNVKKLYDMTAAGNQLRTIENEEPIGFKNFPYTFDNLIKLHKSSFDITNNFDYDVNYSRDGGRYILFEYLEEDPYIIQNEGMESEFVTYFKSDKKSRAYDDYDYSLYEKNSIGTPAVFYNTQTFPYLYEPKPGPHTGIPSINNKLFKAPIEQYKVREEEEEYEDFVLSFGGGDDNKFKIIDIETSYTIGQLHPNKIIPASGGERYQSLFYGRLREFIYECHRRNYTLTMELLNSAFETEGRNIISENGARTKLSGFCEFISTSGSYVLFECLIKDHILECQRKKIPITIDSINRRFSKVPNIEKKMSIFCTLDEDGRVYIPKSNVESINPIPTKTTMSHYDNCIFESILVGHAKLVDTGLKNIINTHQFDKTLKILKSGNVDDRLYTLFTPIKAIFSRTPWSWTSTFNKVLYDNRKINFEHSKWFSEHYCIPFVDIEKFVKSSSSSSLSTKQDLKQDLKRLKSPESSIILRDLGVEQDVINSLDKWSKVKEIVRRVSYLDENHPLRLKYGRDDIDAKNEQEYTSKMNECYQNHFRKLKNESKTLDDDIDFLEEDVEFEEVDAEEDDKFNPSSEVLLGLRDLLEENVDDFDPTQKIISEDAVCLKITRYEELGLYDQSKYKDAIARRTIQYVSDRLIIEKFSRKNRPRTRSTSACKNLDNKEYFERFKMISREIVEDSRGKVIKKKNGKKIGEMRILWICFSKLPEKNNSEPYVLCYEHSPMYRLNRFRNQKWQHFKIRVAYCFRNTGYYVQQCQHEGCQFKYDFSTLDRASIDILDKICARHDFLKSSISSSPSPSPPSLTRKIMNHTPPLADRVLTKRPAVTVTKKYQVHPKPKLPSLDKPEIEKGSNFRSLNTSSSTSSIFKKRKKSTFVQKKITPIRIANVPSPHRTKQKNNFQPYPKPIPKNDHNMKSLFDVGNKNKMKSLFGDDEDKDDKIMKSLFDNDKDKDKDDKIMKSLFDNDKDNDKHDKHDNIMKSLFDNDKDNDKDDDKLDDNIMKSLFDKDKDNNKDDDKDNDNHDDKDKDKDNIIMKSLFDNDKNNDKDDIIMKSLFDNDKDDNNIKSSFDDDSTDEDNMNSLFDDLNLDDKEKEDDVKPNRGDTMRLLFIDKKSGKDKSFLKIFDDSPVRTVKQSLFSEIIKVPQENSDGSFSEDKLISKKFTITKTITKKRKKFVFGESSKKRQLLLRFGRSNPKLILK